MLEYSGNKWQFPVDEKRNGIIYSDIEYQVIINRIISGDHFALLRFADDEVAIARGREITGCDGWKSSQKESKLRSELIDALHMKDDRIVYGISCPCCDSESYYWLRRNIATNNITFANIFSTNYKKIIEDISRIGVKVVFIANENARGKTIPNVDVIRSYYVGSNCIEFWEEKGEQFVKEIMDDIGHLNDILYVVCAGPMSEAIISRLFRNNPNNTYIDFGSVFDLYIHNMATRDYLKNIGSKTVDWMPDPSESIDVDVVLTSYLRPEVLLTQLNAVKEQTLLPRHIFLYQDGIDSYYSIRFDDSLLEQFDGVVSEDKNQGVWGRFAYSSSVCSSQYVCVFDDDTIPERRWLENCHMNMVFKNALYGTNGVIITNPEMKELNGSQMINVGWHSANSKPLRVDYVGHSWFLRKEWLRGMDKNTIKDKYKYGGEDMYLSFLCQKISIDTVVPPHPMGFPELWGSVPKSGFLYGTDKNAISMRRESAEMFSNVLKDVLDLGFKLIKHVDSNYYEYAVDGIENNVINSILCDIKLIKESTYSKYIYGAGDYGQRILSFLMNRGISVDGFITSQRNDEISKKGLPIITCEEFLKSRKESIVILGLSPNHHSEIRNRIQREGITVIPLSDSPYEYIELINYVSLEANG